MWISSLIIWEGIRSVSLQGGGGTTSGAQILEDIVDV